MLIDEYAAWAAKVTPLRLGAAASTGTAARVLHMCKNVSGRTGIRRRRESEGAR